MAKTILRDSNFNETSGKFLFAGENSMKVYYFLSQIWFKIVEICRRGMNQKDISFFNNFIIFIILHFIL